jgi:hypothetical protein
LHKLALALVAAICLVPALAFAADPAKDSAFQYCVNKDSCPFYFETTKNGKYLTDIKLYPKCAPVPVEKWGRIRVTEGKFSKSGKVTDLVGNKLTYSIKGKFKRPKKAVGTYEVDSKDCKDKAVAFVAKRTGKAQEGF